MLQILRALLFIAIAASCAFGQTVRLVADEWCPYNCAQDDKNKGILIDIAEYSLAKHGIVIEYFNLPWARALSAARKGDFSGVVGCYKSDAPDFIFPERPLFQSGQVFYTTASSKWKFDGFPSLESVTLGVIQDYSYGDELDAYIKKNEKNAARVQTIGGDGALITNIKKLLAGRISVVVEDAPVMQLELKKQGAEDKVIAVGELPKVPLYIAFSPKEPRAAEYAKYLSEGVEELKNSGKLAKILAKYEVQEQK